LADLRELRTFMTGILWMARGFLKGALEKGGRSILNHPKPRNQRSACPKTGPQPVSALCRKVSYNILLYMYYFMTIGSRDNSHRSTLSAQTVNCVTAILRYDCRISPGMEPLIMNYRFVMAALAFAGAATSYVPALAAEPAAKPAAPQGAPAPMAKPAQTPATTTYLAANLKKAGWKATATGLQYRVIKAVPAASGPKAASGSIVTVHYDGTFTDGAKFDSSYDRKEPATFELSNVIPGWQEGVPMMREGETWEFAIPSDLAYGPETRGPIPGGSTLLFKVRLLWVATPAPEAKPAAAAPKPAANP
jgi:FKBP-type peptidyl-prolyl cis-trans isomerase FkpA